MEMISVHLMPVIAWLLAVAGFFRVLYMLLYYKEAKATVLAHDYSDGRRHRDSKLWRAVDPDYTRKIAVTAKFNDQSGKSFTVDHRVETQFGKEPDQQYALWYRESDPSQVTIYSWFHWFVLTSIPSIYLILNALPGFE
jgi:hypothetical protein